MDFHGPSKKCTLLGHFDFGWDDCQGLVAFTSFSDSIRSVLACSEVRYPKRWRHHILSTCILLWSGWGGTRIYLPKSAIQGEVKKSLLVERQWAWACKIGTKHLIFWNVALNYKFSYHLVKLGMFHDHMSSTIFAHKVDTSPAATVTGLGFMLTFGCWNYDCLLQFDGKMLTCLFDNY